MWVWGLNVAAFFLPSAKGGAGLRVLGPFCCSADKDEPKNAEKPGSKKAPTCGCLCAVLQQPDLVPPCADLEGGGGFAEGALGDGKAMRISRWMQSKRSPSVCCKAWSWALGNLLLRCISVLMELQCSFHAREEQDHIPPTIEKNAM